jgi:hypothetical protein
MLSALSHPLAIPSFDPQTIQHGSVYHRAELRACPCPRRPPRWRPLPTLPPWPARNVCYVPDPPCMSAAPWTYAHPRPRESRPLHLRPHLFGSTTSNMQLTRPYMENTGDTVPSILDLQTAPTKSYQSNEVDGAPRKTDSVDNFLDSLAEYDLARIYISPALALRFSFLVVNIHPRIITSRCHQSSFKSRLMAPGLASARHPRNPSVLAGRTTSHC